MDTGVVKMTRVVVVFQRDYVARANKTAESVVTAATQV